MKAHRCGPALIGGRIAAALLAACGQLRADGLDNYDSYPVGTDLIDSGNGQLNYDENAYSSLPIKTAAGGYFHVINTDSTSGPNSVEMHDTEIPGGMRMILSPANAIPLTSVGSSAMLSFDFKTIAGTTNRVSNGLRPLFASDATLDNINWIDRPHVFGLEENGLYFLNNGNVTGSGLYQANVWYNMTLKVTRSGSNTYDYNLVVTDLATHVPLDAGGINFAGVSAANRFYFGGLGFDLSSIANETIRLDNLRFVSPSPEWNVDADGSWSVASNWTGGVPNAVDAKATFGSIITAARTVTVDAPQTVGAISFNNANRYTIAGANALTFDVSSGNAAINVTAGSHTINAPILLNDSLDVSVVAGQTLSVQHFRKAATAGLSVNSGTVKILAGGTPNSPAGTSVVSSLAIAAGAVLDLTNNSAIIDYTGAVGTQVGDVRQHLSSGRLTSSSATSLLGLGYGDNAVLAKASFGGQTVDSSSILVKYTFLGDANLDGQVDVADLGNLASSWQSAGVWTNGDFDYNNFVDVNDLGKLASNWQAGVGSPIGPGLADALASLGLPSSVPEPDGTVLGSAVIAVGSITRIRLRRCSRSF